MTDPQEPTAGAADDLREQVRRAAALAGRSLDEGDRRAALDLLDGALRDPRLTGADRELAEMLQSTLVLRGLVPAHLLAAALPTDGSGQPQLPGGLTGAFPGLAEMLARMVGTGAPDPVARGDVRDEAPVDVTADVRDEAPADVTADVTGDVDRLRQRATDPALPAEVRGAMRMMAEASALLVKLQDPDAPEVTARDVRPMAQLAREVSQPGAAEMLAQLELWLRAEEATSAGGEAPAALVEEVQAVLDGAAPDDVLRPVLQRTLGMMRAQESERYSDPAALREASALFEAALAGMGPSHVLADETRHQVAASTLVTAAVLEDDAVRAAAEALVDRICREAPEDDAFEQGRVAVLRSMVLMLRGRADGEAEPMARLNEALTALETALANLPTDHPLLVVALSLLAALLNDRHLSAGLIEDRRAARFWFRSGAAVADAGRDADPVAALVLRAMVVVGTLGEAGDRHDVAATRAALEELETVLVQLPPRHMMVGRLNLLAGTHWLQLGIRTGDAATTDRGMALLTGLDAEQPLDASTRAAMRTASVAATMVAALLNRDVPMLDRALGALQDVADPAGADERVALVVLRGFAHLARHELSGSEDQLAADHLARGAEALALARDLMTRGSPHPVLGNVLDAAARAERAARPGSSASRDLAREALQAGAGEVLLQSDLGDALLSARGAAARARKLALWCLADGEIDEAMVALEHGRALVLHAATTVSGVADQLRAAGMPGLAQEWDQELADVAGRHWPEGPLDTAVHAVVGDALSRRVPRDVRHRALRALRTTAAGSRLFEVPTAAEIRAGLDRLGASALVYLVPGNGSEPGWVLIRPAAGDACAVPVPQLRADHPALTRYLQYTRDAGIAARAPELLERALGTVCSWAWDVVSPLVETALPVPEGASVPRLVVVGTGPLGSVPWHAARGVLASGRQTVACRELQLSYASSARQLLDAAQRPGQHPGLAPLIVGDPDGTLPGAAREAAILAAVHYPGAMLLGRLPQGEGSPFATVRSATVGAVAEHLPAAGRPGATLVHLGCHARYGASPENSYLALAPGEEAGDGHLSVRSVLEQARGRHRGDPGPLVVLSACSSDVTVVLEDEALTLATAFLAAGAVSVVGSRWLVPDARTSVMMFAFHHFLAGGTVQPGEALRAAQLWMLDPDRPELAGMPEVLRGDMTAEDLSALTAWAAFAHHGR